MSGKRKGREAEVRARCHIDGSDTRLWAAVVGSIELPVAELVSRGHRSQIQPRVGDFPLDDLPKVHERADDILVVSPFYTTLNHSDVHVSCLQAEARHGHHVFHYIARQVNQSRDSKSL